MIVNLYGVFVTEENFIEKIIFYLGDDDVLSVSHHVCKFPHQNSGIIIIHIVITTMLLFMLNHFRFWIWFSAIIWSQYTSREFLCGSLFWYIHRSAKKSTVTTSKRALWKEITDSVLCLIVTVINIYVCI